MKNVIAYINYDSYEEAEKEAQYYQNILNKYVEQNKSDEVQDFYIDINKSAFSDRPAYNRLMKDILMEKVDKIIAVGGLNKLSRNGEELSKIAEKVEVIVIEPTIKATKLNEHNETDEDKNIAESFEQLYDQMCKESRGRAISIGKKLAKERRLAEERNKTKQKEEQQ